MKIILNDYQDTPGFSNALTELAEGADTLSMAVSYLQVSGWHLFQQHTRGLNLSRMRIVCTDQLAITPPAAVKLAQSSGVQIHNYSGNSTYHPKVYIAHNRDGHPTRFLLGSANLSRSAFTNSVEAGILSNDGAGLRKLDSWFNDLFARGSVPFTAESLQTMEQRWRAAAATRARSRLNERRVVAPVVVTPQTEDLDMVEDVFSSIRLPICLLSMDYAGNNIRNVARVRVVLANWAVVRRSPGSPYDKQRSELKLLGFASGTDLTRLGRAAQAAASDEEVARLWCAWVQSTPDAELAQFNPKGKLTIAKRVFDQFWKLQPDVREYFLTHAESPAAPQKATLQLIELLCNASPLVQDFSLADITALAPLLAQPELLPDFVREAVIEYKDNKGARSWGPDRRIVPLAWQAAMR